MWCIDQGLTFHAENKLRTVIWDFQGQPVPDHLIEDVAAFGKRLESDAELRSTLQGLMSPAEFDMLRQRAELIQSKRIFPAPPAYRPYPWPMV